MNGDDEYDDIASSVLTPAPSIRRAVRGGDKLKGVQPDLLNHWNSLDKEFQTAGITPEIKSGFRTAEQQNALFRNPVTRARTKGNDGYNQISPHQQGRALDLSFSASQRSKGRQIIADYAKRNGLTIPSDEPWHLQLPKSDPYDEIATQAIGTKPASRATPQGDEYDDIAQSALTAPTTTEGVKAGMQGIRQPREKVSVEARPVEFQGETPQAPIEGQPAPVPFIQSNAIPRKATPLDLVAMPFEQPEPSGTVENQLTQERYKTPPSTDLGQAVKIPFSPHLNPTEDDLVKGYLNALGPEYAKYGEKYKQETGRNILSLSAGDVDRDPDGSAYVKPTRAGVDILNAYVKSGGDLKAAQSEGARIAQERRGALTTAQQQAAPDIAEVEAARKSEGAEGSLKIPLPVDPLDPNAQKSLDISGRAITGPAERFIAGIGKMVGGLSSLGGLTPNQFSDYMNRKSEITQLGASLPPLTAEGKEIQKNVPEKVATALGDLGYTVFEIAVLKKVTGLSAAQVMALETALKTSDKPAAERAAEVAKNYALGSVLDANVGRLTSGAIFGVPTAAQGAQEALRNNDPTKPGYKDPYDVLLDTGIQGGIGAILGGGKSEGLTNLGIEQAPAVGVPGESTANIDQRLAEREAKVQPFFLRDDQGDPVARVLNPDEVVQGEKPKVRPIHHSDIQARDDSGKFAEEVPAKESIPPTELIASQPSTASASKPPEPSSQAAQPAQAETTATPPLETSKTEPATSDVPSITSARKDQLAADRAELDLPELPQAERKSWRTSLINAKEKGLDQRAERLADQVIQNPRALDDEQTAGMVLRLQQLKNEHAELLKLVDNESDPETLRQHRADLESVEESFDKITEAVKKSGTEKGRSLASQKLTINQDFDLVSMLNRYKAKTGKEPTPEIRSQIEAQQKRIADLESQLADRSTKGAVDKIAREVRRENRQRTRKVLDEEAVTIKTNLAAEFARVRSRQGIQSSGLAGLDPEGAITKLALKYAKNRFEAGLTDAAQLVDDVHNVLSEFTDVTKRQVAEMISGYGGLKPRETKEQLEKSLADLRKEMRASLRQADIDAGVLTAKHQGPKLSEATRKEGPDLGPRQGPRETKRQIQSRYQKQISEIERRIREQDFLPKAKRGPTILDSETQKIQVNLERAKQDFQRKLREWESSQRTRTEKIADLTVNWARAAKLMYVSTLGKLSSAATGRMVMSPLENLVGEIPHRLMPELSRKATTEGGGFERAAEVAALWKSGRFRQVLDQLTKGSSDLDVLLGSRKSIDKEMSRGGLLGIPGRVHGAFKEYPRQAEFDRAFIKTLRNYDREGRDITRPDVQLAARMEAFNSAERARFQQRNFISDTFNSAMSTLERKGIAGKSAAKVGRFIFPITRVPVNVASETLNYTLGLPRAVIETAIRGGVKNLTTEQANNIMRAYKKGGVGLAVMTYAFLRPQQFGGYYRKGDKRDPNEPKAGEIMFFGKRIPKIFTHVPILEAAQLAATARRVMDSMVEQGKDSAIVEGGLAAGKGLAEQVPFYETPARFFTGKEGSRGVAQLGGEQVRGMIPGFIQEGAHALDKGASGETVKRTPSGSFAQRFGQTIELGIPKARENVPINDLFGTQATKASDEVQRLQIAMKGVQKQPDESQKEFEGRQSRVNPYIRRTLEAVVGSPDYDKESDENKIEWLKQAAASGRQEGEDAEPEKPEKPEKREFPIPLVPRGLKYQPTPRPRW